MLIQKFWEEIIKADRIVSYNGYKFDGYIMKIRSILHDIDIPMKFLKDRTFHIDLLQFLSEGDTKRNINLNLYVVSLEFLHQF
ncbi:hypothetical protein [Aquifex aeolicus]|uniref:hypothetical protein n=1 Tax=Aquifex aeolicus TaxID=63363 RepID=UPI0013E8E870